MSSKANPTAVIIGDIHFSTSTLDLASHALIEAKNLALELSIPLILNGDIHDTKDIIRATYANQIIDILTDGLRVNTIINTGNHDLINEKSEQTSLEFLRPYVNKLVVKRPISQQLGYIIPYQTSAEVLQSILDNIPINSRIIIHQGVQTAYMGHYTQDKTSLPKEAFKDFRVIASHYHKRQDIKCGPPRKGAVGLFSYIGNPYTLNFGEANDGPKGISILYDDGLTELVPLNLRKHVILETHINELNAINTTAIQPNDLVWVKLHGPLSGLKKLNKNELGKRLFNNVNYKLDLIPDKSEGLQPILSAHTSEQVFDKIIDALSDTDNHKNELKDTWRDLLK